ncbi:MAG: hypothetical protein LIO37_02340 [Clostridiales bacterium]|nr:hypothetical protein [Clostridiales bacterium]
MNHYPEIFQAKDPNLLSDRLFHEDNMYAYLECYASDHGLLQTGRVLPYARNLHNGQIRKGHDHVPYIYHPLLVACHAVSLGLDDDDLVSAALLHDVCEDCGVVPEELPVNETARRSIALLTNLRGKAPEVLDEYYAGIASDKIATMVKLIDRCNNVSEMASAFPVDKMRIYIEETEHWVYPLIRYAKKEYPEYESRIFLIQYQIKSVIETVKHMMLQV